MGRARVGAGQDCNSSQSIADLHWCDITRHLASLESSVSIQEAIDGLSDEVGHVQVRLWE